MADAAQIAAYVSYLTQTKTIVEIQAMADTAAAEVADGTKITSVSFEGGGGSAQMFFTPGERLEACMTAISQLGGISGVTPSVNTRVVFPNFNSMVSQT